MLANFTTQAQFRDLPLLLTYSQVLACGVKEHDLKAYLEAGQITYVQLRPGGRKRYRKRDLAKILGLEL